jgi:nucleotide-binding universal stress UspA family protein
MITTPQVDARVNGGSGPLPSYHRILVPLDGSQLSELALPHAEALARLAGAELVILRCYTAPPPIEPTAALGVTLARGAFAPAGHRAGPAPPLEEAVPDALAARQALDLRQRIDRYLDGIAERLHAAGVRADVVRLEGSAGEVVVAEAIARAADLIVMATHARGGIARLVAGSVADHVLHRAPCPVFLVHPAPR